MRFEKYLGVLFVAVILVVTMVCVAEAKTLSAEYSFSNSTTKKEYTPISSELITLKIETSEDAECRYSLSKDFSFNDEGKSFEPNLGKDHEKSFDIYKLNEGINEYYIKCIKEKNINNDLSQEPPVLTLRFIIDKPVSAKIFLPGNVESPLKAGKYEIKLETSEPVSNKPSLSYYFDDNPSHKISLSEIRREDNLWKGYIIIPEDAGEKVLTFEFSADDLKKNTGTRITQNEIIPIDTVSPEPISDIEAIGYKGKIKIKWHYNSDAEEFNVYRSESREVDKTDFYETSDDTLFMDDFVEKGETYYYRVAPVDEAGNEARLSLEVSASATSENSSDDETGLDISLRGKVDNFLTEADSLISQIDNIKSSMDSKTEDKKELFSLLKLERELDNAASKLKSLKRSVSGYKKQDLSESELDNKLSSARTQMNVIEKTIPEEISVKEKETQNNDISEEDIEKALLETKPEMSESLRQESIEKSLEVIKNKEIEIKTDFYLAEILYFDGSSQDISVVKRTISSSLGPHSNMAFLEIVPKQVAENAEDIDFENSAYDIVKEDPIISFSSDVKQIAYSLNKEVSLDNLKDTGLVFITTAQEREEGIDITGYFMYDVESSYLGAALGLIIIGILMFYLFYLKKNKPSEEFLELKKLIEKTKDFLNKGEIKKSLENYNILKGKYNALEEKEKSRIYNELHNLFLNIKLKKLKKGIKFFKKSPDKELLKNLSEIYEELPKSFKKKVPEFEKLKNNEKNEEKNEK